MWFYNYLSANMNNLLDGSFIDQVGHSPGGLLLGLDISLDEDVDQRLGWRHLASIIIWIC